MRARVAVVSLMLTMIGTAGLAAPLDPALQQELLSLYDRYNKAIMAGNLADAATQRTTKPRSEIQTVARKPKAAQRELLDMARMMVPDEISPIHATIAADSKSAQIIVLGSKTAPANARIQGGPKPGTVTHGEVTLTFEREGTAWKFADQLFGPDPSSIKPCHDTATETESEYDPSAQTNTGGVIRRVEFKPDHTLIVIRVVDEENCLILPSRGWLSQHDGHPDKLVPWAVIEADGMSHRSDKQRMWADKWTTTDE